jgi:hypothetical protein
MGGIMNRLRLNLGRPHHDAEREKWPQHHRFDHDRDCPIGFSVSMDIEGDTTWRPLQRVLASCKPGNA